MKSVMLACARFKGRHTADNIYQQYQETLSAFEISSRIASVVTDNASNMLKAFNFDIPGFVDTQSTEDLTREDDGDFEDEPVESPDPEEDNSTLLSHLPERFPCFAHTLQLVIHDGLKDAGTQTSKLIAKASRIVSHVKKSTLATDVLEGKFVFS